MNNKLLTAEDIYELLSYYKANGVRLSTLQVGFTQNGPVGVGLEACRIGENYTSGEPMLWLTFTDD